MTMMSGSLAMWLVWAACLVSVVLVPFTKVEESFNLQAIHDLVHHRENISHYDHLDFPGVVPRTFLGSLMVALPTSLLTMAHEALSPHASKELGLVIARASLAAFNCLALWRLYRAVQTRFSPQIATFMAALTAVQFHLVFYMSRTLPNTFALALVLLAFSYWLESKLQRTVVMFAIAAPVFRAELVVLAGPVLLSEMLQRNISLSRLLLTGIPAGLLSIAVSVGVDSFFWQRLLWPEGEVLWFNTILNKSSNYGTEPFLWYFYSALPRCLSASLLLVPVGIFAKRKLLRYLLPVLAFVFLYSFLPHKELRFVLYAVPMLTIAAAAGADYLWRVRSGHGAVQRAISAAARAVVVGVFVGCILSTALFTAVSRENYPGGHAFRWLHANCDDACGSATAPVSVHVCNLAAQTGVSRFGETNPHFRYSKAEEWTDDLSWRNFTWLIAEPKDEPQYAASHKRVAAIQGLDRVSTTSSWPFIRINKRDALLVLRAR
ncbi:hypothetical protein PTSG_11395 [Salpingoeca rosetta]|uniref:Mannosyltransferase n=1 Tax=Salpingoeca rosetta (strain ATCC 50818 / BSB-021) TaxID=946362 RepID=F2UTA0_SALR5|nr:uncharacterized protein PTSG_11395 [Salpingoeca rosetta]EGD81856.1 hypothetical protein PTSG_11395 [Salpingoeca rosetta]|eukprot:XP_004987604.1 hypothetical protein PTSG_11395 [Salpingoeca rosetta]